MFEGVPLRELGRSWWALILDVVAIPLGQVIGIALVALSQLADTQGRVTYLPDPEREYDAWCEQLADVWGVPPEVSMNFELRGRTCIAMAINPGLQLKPCQGVLLVESQVIPSEATYTSYLNLRKLKQFLKK